MGLLDNQIVVVTGAGRGLGRAHALYLASEGAKVVVNDYGGDPSGNPGTSEQADAVVAEIAAAGGEAVADAHDVSIDGAAIVQTALTSFGGLHGVVNNAGVSDGGDIDKLSPDAIRRLFEINTLGAFAIIAAAWPVFREQGYGRIVNTSSGAALGNPYCASYSAAKAALLGLTRTLAIDGTAHDIKVNAIMPAGFTRLTAMDPSIAEVCEAAFQPELISPFVAALISPDVPVTGETYDVGGGRAARVVFAGVDGHQGPTSAEGWLRDFDKVHAGDLQVFGSALDAFQLACVQVGITPPGSFDRH
ncbi:SDR family NAD(P)-dependent oxidoreductase [Rhodococcus globerulus]|uniref:SDR family NAD(P)-dependent oxidoreductase n=1 Tax=Rhodococcus globerulus TaxID=33008 RepID=UPI0030194AC6